MYMSVCIAIRDAILARRSQIGREKLQTDTLVTNELYTIVFMDTQAHLFVLDIESGDSCTISVFVPYLT